MTRYCIIVGTAGYDRTSGRWWRESRFYWSRCECTGSRFELVADSGMWLLKGPRLTGSAGWPGARVAVVTGAGRGVGRGEAIDLARNGWRVVVNDLDTVHAETDDATGRSADTVVREIVQAGGQAVADYNDVADPNGADALISTALSAFGGLDAVVNNA